MRIDCIAVQLGNCLFESQFKAVLTYIYRNIFFVSRELLTSTFDPPLGGIGAGKASGFSFHLPVDNGKLYSAIR